MDSTSNNKLQATDVLRAEDLGRSVAGKVVVAGATFAISTGEVLAIVGPSGSGKSSLLRLLNRLDEPTSGTVYVEGTNYRQIEPRHLRRKLGLVTQRPFLFPGTVFSNVEFGPRQRGEVLSPKDVDDLLSRVGLDGFGPRDVANLSGGEAQRVSLARTLANSPLVLLLDEPTSALDDASKADVESLVKNVVSERRLTCIVVTHDRAQAVRLAQRALSMNAGRVVRDGPVSEGFDA